MIPMTPRLKLPLSQRQHLPIQRFLNAVKVVVFCTLFAAPPTFAAVSGTAPTLGTLPAPAKLAQLVEELKAREQGPFKGIYWYCPDGRRHRIAPNA